jgi:Fe-S cluster assembly protein SufD
VSGIVDQAVTEFRNLQRSLPGHELPWLDSLRAAAARRFSERGWPTPRDEAWKYTNVAPVVKKGFVPLPAPGDDAVIDVSPWLLPGTDAIRLVFVDGHYVPALSAAAGLPGGVVVASLKDRLREAPDELESWLATDIMAAPQGFSELNTAFMSDGAIIRVPAGVAVGRPVHLLYIARESARPCAAFLRNLIIVAEGGAATIVQHHVSADGAHSLVNSLTRCVVEDGASLEHYSLNEQGDGVYHFAATQLRQGRDSRYVSHNLQAGARLARSDMHAELAGEGCECTLNGFYLGRDRQHIDNCLRIEHLVPRCSSRQLYKGVLDGRARGIFNGHVVVRQDAQQTDARQMNQSLLLSEQAEADTRPQLEIYADDVKCSHGATVGQLDRDALFYLKARGIDEAVARSMLIGAFAGEIAERLTLEPVRCRFERLVAARLAH